MSTRVDRTTLGPNDDGRRLDRVLRKYLPDVPLSRIYRALRSREIAVNGKRARADTRVFEGDVLEIAETLHSARIRRTEEPDGAGVGASTDQPHDGRKPAAATRRAKRESPPALAGRIVFESRDLIVVNKMRGELTHGPDSLETIVREYLAGRGAGGVSFRPGPVHRLDRNTSGLVIFAASLAGAHRAGEALRTGRLEKRYLALVEGRLRAARWEDRLERDESSRTTGAAGGGGAGGRGGSGGGAGGRVAVSVVEPVVADRDATLAVIRIETGRTHQIRAQAALHGHPLAGDRKYGGHGRSAYLLHAASLTAPAESDIGFEHLEAPLPAAFAERIERVFGAGTLRIASRALSGPHE